MKISIVVPSFNQAEFLENCLSSIVTQQCDLELLVVDGGSTDGSADIIREFESRISWWVSEKDAGQTDAINKGLKRATGDVWAYVNSDDRLEPLALDFVVKFFSDHPEANWLSGGCRVFGEGVREWFLNPAGFKSFKEVLTPWSRPNPYVFPQSGACFMRRTVIQQIGFFDPTYHYSMDMEYYTRAALKGNITQYITNQCLAAWRWHEEAKSFQKGIAYAFREDEIRIAEEYLKFLNTADQSYLRRELKAQRREVLLRKAMWNHHQGNALAARRLLWQTLGKYPASIVYRPWLGAVRRVLLGKAD